MAFIKQVIIIITWAFLIVSVKILEGVDGQIHSENRYQRRYGSRNQNLPSRQTDSSSSNWFGSRLTPQMSQQPKYLDISLDLLGQHSSHLLFPDPLRIDDYHQKPSNEFVSSKQPPPPPPDNFPYQRPFQHAKRPIPYRQRDDGSYTSLMQAAEAAASSTYHATAATKKPYPYRAQRPLFISYPTYGIRYQQQQQQQQKQQSSNYDPMMNYHHQYNYINNQLTAASSASSSSSSSHYSLNNPLGLSSCCNGGNNQWKPLGFTQSPPPPPLPPTQYQASEIPQVISSDPILTDSSSKQQMSLYLPVKLYDVVAESERVTKMIPSKDSQSNSTPPTTLYIPVPKENNTIIEGSHNDTNLNDTLHDDSDLPSGSFDNVALTSTPLPAIMEVATVKPTDEKPQTVTAATIKQTTPINNPTTKATTSKPRATTARDTEKATTTAEPKTKPPTRDPPARDPPATASSEAASDDVPQRPPIQRPPPRPISPVEDSLFENAPVEDPGLEGVPGDLPTFEDVPADAPAGEGGESPLPGIFSEFLNQVADMIEEFQPTTEIPLGDDPQGLADGSVADDFASASDTAQDSIPSGSDTDGNFESFGGEGGGQDGGDFGVEGPNFDNFESGPGANDNFDEGGQQESLPLANNPVSTSVQPGAIAGGTPTVGGEQSAPSQSNAVSVTGAYPSQNPTVAAAAVSDVAYAPSNDKNKQTASNPTLPTGAAQTSVSSEPYPSAIPPINSPNYDPAPIASQPQIHPPATDYVDPGVYNSFPPIPLPQIAGTLSSNGAVGLNNKQPQNQGLFPNKQPQNQELFPNRVQDEYPSYNNEFPHSDGYEQHVEATTIFEHFAMPEEYPQPSNINSNPNQYGPIMNNNEFASQMSMNNDTIIDYDTYSNNETYHEEQLQPILPVSNHLGTYPSQPWNEPTSPPATYSNVGDQSILLTSTTEIPLQTSSVSHQYPKEKESDSMDAPYENPNTKVDVISPQYIAENNLESGVTSTLPPTNVEHQPITAELINSPPPLAFATPTTMAPDTTIKEYVSSDKPINEWSNHLDDYHPEDSQSSSVEYSEGDVPDAEGIPADILPEVQKNINMDLLKTANLAKG